MPIHDSDLVRAAEIAVRSKPISDEDVGTARLVARARKDIAAGAPLIPKKIVDRIAAGENALRVLREWRDITQLYLSFKTDIGKATFPI